MENTGYLIAAYTIIWVVIFGYVFYLFHKQRKLRQRTDLFKYSIVERPNRSVSGANNDDNPGG